MSMGTGMGSNALVIRKLTAVSDLVRLPKQYGTLLVLWPTLWSLFIASDGSPTVRNLFIFIAGTFLMRSAGCAINDVADRNFDPYVERTRSRPLANGRLNVKEALLVFAALVSLSFIAVLFLNRLTIALSFIGLLLAVVYPFVKRVSHWPQAFLGMAFGWGAVMSWSAATGTIGWVPLLIFVANVCYSIAYDTIYALMDREDDLKIGVKSTAIYFGDSVYAALNAAYLLMTVLLAATGYLSGLGPVYFGGLASGLMIFLWIVSVLKRTPTRAMAFKGFIGNVVAGGVILAAIVIDMRL
ncbi:MAG: 4-hydroxybenzoate octaprenyltransferase [Deltaproteobacteria bacterium]|nr:4-hydroxybenzoate octaprenyltransferase [Deltaproteobacteria bacterium]